MSYKNLTEVKRQSPEALLTGLIGAEGTSLQAAARLVNEAKETGLCLTDYLKLACDPHLSSTPERFAGLNGFEATLAHLNLPFRDDFENGVTLRAASDTFQRYPGTRAMFPEVVDQMLRFKTRQDQIESVSALVSQSRTIDGNEMISTAIEMSADAAGSFTVAEGGRFPIRTLRTSNTGVGIFKHGSGIQTTYEFQRRASLDILTPYAARVGRELELSKVTAATQMLINGDTVNLAATVQGITTFGGVVIGTKSLSEQYKAFAKWLVTRAKAGTPIDTVVGNLDMYLELLFMFTPSVSAARSQAEAIAAKGGPSMNLSIPLLSGNVNFALSSAMPNNKILGFSKAETLEELVENGSTISENERSIQTQTVTYIRSENTGYKIAYGDTRSILDLTA